MTAHRGVPDPAFVVGTREEIDRAFREVFSILERRISLFLSPPISSFDQMALQRHIDEIGHR